MSAGKSPPKPPPAAGPPKPPPLAGPPKPPGTARIGLTEVERAISVLEGRHPEHEKMARQTREAAEKRATEIARELAASARARLLRRIGTAAVVAGALIAGSFAWRVAQRTRALHAALEGVEGPWLGAGFASVASNELTGSARLEEDLPGSSCFVAMSTQGTLRAAAGAMTVEGPRVLEWCACAPAHVTVDAPPSAGGAAPGLAVLRADGAAVGGPLARTWSSLKPAGWGETGGETAGQTGGGGETDCAGTMLDGWIEAHRPKTPAPEAAWLDADAAKATMHRAGMRVVATVEPAHPFAIVDAAAGDCSIAVSQAGEPLSLRAAGGAWLVSQAKGALAWCSSQAATLTVWRDGQAPVAVLAMPGARIGGLLGTRECAESAGVSIPAGATWLRREDRAWDADALLRASGASNVTSAPLLAEPGAPDGRVVALSLSPEAQVVAEPEGALLVCDPPIGGGEAESLCAHGAPVAWFNKKDAAAGAARGSLPVWLALLEGRREPDALARIPELLALTRRLTREGFEPVMFEGATELADGVRVTGRAGEDAVVAVGLSQGPPWALPYTDGVPWDLGDAPREVPLKPGDSVKLTGSPLPKAPLSARRTVVFRHSSIP